MKVLVSGALALGLLGSTGYLSLHPANGSKSAAGPAGADADLSVRAHPVFALAKAGVDQGCAVTMGATLPMQRAELELTEACAAMMPALAKARYWQDNSDGTVAFISDEGRAVVEFFAADGVAYESFRPETALLSLSASR